MIVARTGTIAMFGTVALTLAACAHDDRTAPGGRTAYRPAHVFIGAAPPATPPVPATAPSSTAPLVVAILAALVLVASIAFIVLRRRRTR